MATKLTIFDGDQVFFLPIPGTTIIPMLQGVMKANSKVVFGGKKLCVEGDEKKVVVPCTYMTPAYTIPGTGNLIIEKLAADQLSKKAKMGNKRIIRKGTFFQSKFQAIVKAMNPVSGSPDPVGVYSGQGQLITSNSKIQVD